MERIKPKEKLSKMLKKVSNHEMGIREKKVNKQQQH
jgi:hypothetical protein